jgi:hypothetical protein
VLPVGPGVALRSRLSTTTSDSLNSFSGDTQGVYCSRTLLAIQWKQRRSFFVFTDPINAGSGPPVAAPGIGKKGEKGVGS